MAASAAALAALGFGLDFATASITDPVMRLSGRWSGLGTVTPVSGAAESFKCVITYFPSSDGARLKQNLRCQSPSYKLDTATMLDIDGTRRTGKWEDRIYSLNGSVSGTLTKDGFDVQLSGRFFNAKMAVAGSQCEQSVRVSPERADYIREISASLKKC